MTNPNGDKGAATERMVAKYLREQGFPMADRRLREGRADDQGDIDGVPFTTVQVKYVESNRYPKWVADTLRQRNNAGTPLCLIVRRIPRKPVAQWEASFPTLGLPESEAWTWKRMDLRLAVDELHRQIATEKLGRSLSGPSLSTTVSEGYRGAGRELRSAQSTENDGPASPTV